VSHPPSGEALTPVRSTYLVQGDTKSSGLSRTPQSGLGAFNITIYNMQYAIYLDIPKNCRIFAA